MSGIRAFDDDRWPDEDLFSSCFLCGKKVDPLDPKRGSYEEAPGGPRLYIHLACVEGVLGLRVSELYHQALNQMGSYLMRQR